MEEKTEYKAGDQGQISGGGRPARRSAAPSDESAKTTRQPAHHHGQMVRMFEVFCLKCDRSDLVGFGQERDDAELEAFEVGWSQNDQKWICPDHSGPEVTDPGS